MVSVAVGGARFCSSCKRSNSVHSSSRGDFSTTAFFNGTSRSAICDKLRERKNEESHENRTMGCIQFA